MSPSRMTHLEFESAGQIFVHSLKIRGWFAEGLGFLILSNFDPAVDAMRVHAAGLGWVKENVVMGVICPTMRAGMGM